MVRLGLIGYPLGHSFSARYFAEKFASEGIQGEYRLFPLEDEEEVERFVADCGELSGFNVTIPYKQRILRHLDGLSEEAAEIGAVNTVKVSRKDREDIELTGHNTDCAAFRESLKPLLRSDIGNALVLGTGGAARAVAHALKQLGIRATFVSRRPSESDLQPAIEYAETDREVIGEHPLIINTTPVGMFPATDSCPDIPYQFIGKKHLCYDLVYNPETTEFMRRAGERGAKTKNGLEMLHRQAEMAWEIWNGDKPGERERKT